MLDQPLPYAKTECHTISVILGTFVACLGAFILLSVLLYMAYFKPLYDAHKDCLRQQSDNEHRSAERSEVQKFDIQDRYAYPRYIHDEQMPIEMPCKQSYIKHREGKRRRKKRSSSSLSTINENYILQHTGNTFSRSTLINGCGTDEKLYYSYKEEPQYRCHCRDCTLARIMLTKSTTTFLGPPATFVHFAAHSTPV